MQKIIISILFLLLAGCTTDVPVESFSQREINTIYDSAVELLEKKEFELAANEFLNIEREYPYSNWSEQALIMASYSYFEERKYKDAINQLTRYTQLYPNGKNLAYANYLIGQSYYLQIANVGRDQYNAKKALERFNIILERFPSSDYAADARLKKDLAIDHIAGAEMEIGRFYQKRKQFTAAINRFKEVISEYQTTSHIDEALARYSESYLSLGIYVEAQTSAAILGYNYPNSNWYTYIYNELTRAGLKPKEEPETWIKRIWRTD
ncbi:outer membrane protein assembly factor BamD [Gammaproteobacteria bacterium]|nr:outer membrane protein assembly factor BamD [Gammaproteobacteria bacterium]|tara:strand:+ start:342 stop:1139 length:798 start_codon:yes stop_codon:yes gene_type:complete